MTPLEFFRTPEATRAIERAARCAAMPLSLHFLGRGEEGVRIISHGQCAACSYVARWPKGVRACRASREEAARTAFRREGPVSFVCHMGFACTTTPALPEHTPGFALTFGPYCPAEEWRFLATSALDNLTRLLEDEAGLPEDFSADVFPVSLADIRVVPTPAAPGLAEWTSEVLGALWDECHVVAPEPPASREEVPQDIARHAKPDRVLPDPYQAAPIAAALAGGEQGQARALVRAALSESRSAPRARIAAKRARLLAIAAAALEAAERAEMSTGAGWDQFPELLADVRQARTDAELVNAAMRVLGILKRKAVRQAAPETGYIELNQILLERLPERITLNEVAARLGQTPTAITHRLQRKFGMSFSEYAGRLRIDKAKELLRRTKLSATEVAQRVGIRDVSNFGKLFRKFEGMSPLKYRGQFGSKQ